MAAGKGSYARVCGECVENTSVLFKRPAGRYLPGAYMVCWWYGMMVRCCILCGINTVGDMACWWYGIYMGKTRSGMWYGMLVAWYDGTVSWMYYMAKYACGMVCFTI